MPNREDVLREQTFKGEFAGDDIEVERRVYHTLSGDKASDGPKRMTTPTPAELSLALHRTQKLLGAMVALVITKGLMTDDELDTLLLNATY